MIIKFLFKEKIKFLLKKVFNRFGIQLTKYNQSSDLATITLSLSVKYKIKNILDVGANIGQFSRKLRNIGFEGRIISFEPLSDPHKILSKISKDDDLWTVYPRTAVGSITGEIDINVSKNFYSSSILPMNLNHEEHDIDSVYVDKEKVRINTLNNIFWELGIEENFFIKIDTQGFEWEVLQGSDEILNLPNCKAVICELSLHELYKGQKLWLEVISFIEQRGFKVWSLYPGFSDNKKGKLLQMDAVFLKEN